MTDFHSLDPETRAFALVGCFLAQWAIMESNIREAMGKALGLDQIQVAIINANIQLRDKIHIVRTAVDISPIYPETEKERYKKVLMDISDYSHNRNMMAHGMFGPSTSSDGVEFFVTKAKGKLVFPDVNWSMSKFNEEYERIKDFADELRNLTKRLDTAAFLKAAAEARFPAPMPSILGLTVTEPPYLPPQDDHDLEAGPSMPQTDPQIPPSDKK